MPFGLALDAVFNIEDINYGMNMCEIGNDDARESEDVHEQQGMSWQVTEIYLVSKAGHVAVIARGRATRPGNEASCCGEWLWGERYREDPCRGNRLE